MLTIERFKSFSDKQDLKKSLYVLTNDGNGTLAVIEGLRAAACVLRFLKGAHLRQDEYQLALDTMSAIDAKTAERKMPQ